MSFWTFLFCRLSTQKRGKQSAVRRQIRKQIRRESAKTEFCQNLANLPASYRSLSGPPGPKSQKGLKKVSSAPGPQKVWKKSRKSPRSLGNSRKCLGLFPDFLGRRGPGEFFQTFLEFRAQRARETPVTRGRVCNKNSALITDPTLRRFTTRNFLPQLRREVHPEAAPVPPSCVNNMEHLSTLATHTPLLKGVEVHPLN